MVGRTVLQYELLEKLGAGGMGEVYKARDTRLNRFVALKVLPAAMSADPEFRRRFIREAQAASALNHPNIITIYDIVSDGDTQYMVVEYVSGKTLLELIPKDGLRVPQVLRYAVQMAEALSAAHAAGIIHRDLKPANIMVTNTGLVKLLDFGLAKLIDPSPFDDDGNRTTVVLSPLTVAGTIMGTVNYMSPEQAEGRKLDARADIFSFGAVLYEMLTGRYAFSGKSTVSTLSAVLRDNVQPIVDLTPDVPSELERIVVRCLFKDPDQRFQSMQEVQAALAAVQRQSDSATVYTRPAAVPPAPARQRASRGLAIGAAAVFVVAAAGGVGYWRMTRQRVVPTPATVTQPTASAPSPDETMTNDRIVEMVRAKVDPSVIVSQIRASKTNFDLSASEVIRLSKAGVPATVIEAMRHPRVDPFADKTAAPAAEPETTSPATLPSLPATPVVLGDGVPVHLTLTEDVLNDAAEGAAIHFQVADDVLVNDTVVIPKGSAVVGVIVDEAKKKILGIGGKMTFRLDKVDAVDGQKVTIRATPAPHRDGLAKRAVDTGANKKSRDVAASAGAGYVAYIDGANTLLLKK